MSLAEKIYHYIAEHGSATRPELRDNLGMHETAVVTTMRKLIIKGFVSRTGHMRSYGEGRAAPVFIVGRVAFTQEAFTNGPIPRGRPRKIAHQFASLESAIRLMFEVGEAA
ncbi:hypothetical protein [Burkholderia pseudomallei]|uniref:hypothetical protein n=1 Tax=Burkholderia pseudomallei TaxID=28450 RepID=UPI00100AA039|nr:hypothetical protein [Burkholderia pseudomallei]